MPNFTSISLLSFFLFFSVVLPKTQPPCVPNSFGLRHLDRYSGLSSARVDAMTQDHLGFLWLGMESGLQRYNGKSFQSFRHQPGDSTSLPDNVVRAVHSDKVDRVWVATSSGICRYLPETGGFKTYTIRGGQVNLGFPSRFMEDSRGDLWLATSGESGLFRLRAGSDTWERCALPARTAILGRNIAEDPKTGNIWLMYKVSGKEMRLGYIDLKTGQLNPGPTALNTLVRDACHFAVDRDRGLWTSRIKESWNPEFLFRYDLSTGQIRRFDIPTLSFSPLFIDKKDRVWFFDPENKQFGFIESRQGRPRVYCWPYSSGGQTALSGEIRDIFEDREGNVWIATNDGVFVFNPFAPRFLPVYVNGQENSGGKIQNPLAVWESPEGKIWIGTFGNGTFLLDHHLRVEKKIFTPVPRGYDAPAQISDKNLNIVWSFSSDQDGNIWAGCQSGVLMQFSPSGKLLWKGQDPALDFQTVRSLARDSNGYIWAGTQGGILARIDPGNKEITRFEAMSPYSKTRSRLYQIIPDKAGWLWLFYRDQILHYHTRAKSWNLVRFSGKSKIEPGAGYEFSTGAVSWGKDSLLVYGRDVYWLDKKRRVLGEVGQSRALPALAIRFAARIGNDLVLALSTGVVRWSPLTGKLVSYSVQDGLPDNFSEVPNSGCQLPDGRIVLGMDSEGVYVFHPDNMRKADTHPPDVRIDGIWIKGQQFFMNPYAPPKNLRLRHSENFLTVRYACTTLEQQHHLRFRYRLKGNSRDWVDNGGKRSVELTGLSPGHYVLEVQVRNREGLDGLQTAQLPIQILPPWYLSWPALLAYTALFCYGLYALYRFQLSRRLAMAEVEQVRALDAFKSEFFMNITHEFRTPLAVIQGMAQQIKAEPEQYLYSGLALIQRNGDRLLELVNQVLELSRLQEGKLSPNWQRGDIVPFLRYLVDSFDTVAKMRDIVIEYSEGADVLQMDFDMEKIQTALGNLLSNAVKFTPVGGRITVESGTTDREGIPDSLVPWSVRYLYVRVRDTGPGIAPEDLVHIFDRYYQVKGQEAGGAGIGLTLSRELARLMGGDVTVESTRGEGAEFTLWVPVLQLEGEVPGVEWTEERMGYSKDLEGWVPWEADAGQAADLAPEGSGPLLLLVEDSPDMLFFLRVCLGVTYRILEARDGRSGLEKAVAHIPDLIISDIMMPELDGLALCAALKTDVRTSHIPVILLTARAGLSNKVEGLKLGADDYLVKPFERAELLARIGQLLGHRMRMQAFYRGFALGVAGEKANEEEGSAEDNAFIVKVRNLVNARLDEPDFNAIELEAAIGMSHSQFYRKLDALLGYSASALIRKMRVQKAQELLLGSSMGISEIAYKVGFSDPMYFSRVFRKEMGLSPREYRERGA